MELPWREEQIYEKGTYLELVNHSISVKEVIPKVLDWLTRSCITQCKHIKGPLIQCLKKYTNIFKSYRLIKLVLQMFQSEFH